LNDKLRDILLFLGGATIVMHQAFIAHEKSPVVIGAGLSMMLGAPVVYRLLNRWDRK
jgi:hypothetical protein